jgi:hypothetical protein
MRPREPPIFASLGFDLRVVVKHHRTLGFDPGPFYDFPYFGASCDASVASCPALLYSAETLVRSGQTP